jgi:hypothetical protein
MTSNRETAMFWLAEMRRQLAALAEDPQQRCQGGHQQDESQDCSDEPTGVTY